MSNGLVHGSNLCVYTVPWFIDRWLANHPYTRNGQQKRSKYSFPSLSCKSPLFPLFPLGRTRKLDLSVLGRSKEHGLKKRVNPTYSVEFPPLSLNDTLGVWKAREGKQCLGHPGSDTRLRKWYRKWQFRRADLVTISNNDDHDDSRRARRTH